MQWTHFSFFNSCFVTIRPYHPTPCMLIWPIRAEIQQRNRVNGVIYYTALLVFFFFIAFCLFCCLFFCHLQGYNIVAVINWQSCETPASVLRSICPIEKFESSWRGFVFFQNLLTCKEPSFLHLKRRALYLTHRHSLSSFHAATLRAWACLSLPLPFPHHWLYLQVKQQTFFQLASVQQSRI